MLWLLELQIRRGRKVQTQVHTVNSNSRTSNCHCSLLSKKNPIIQNFCLSKWLAAIINPEKWSSTAQIVIVLFYISLPSWTNINTLFTTADRERVYVFRADLCVQKTGHLGPSKLMSPRLNPTLSQVDPIHTLNPYFFKNQHLPFIPNTSILSASWRVVTYNNQDSQRPSDASYARPCTFLQIKWRQ